MFTDNQSRPNPNLVEWSKGQSLSHHDMMESGDDLFNV
jgi:hypothetical protein